MEYTFFLMKNIGISNSAWQKKRPKKQELEGVRNFMIFTLEVKGLFFSRDFSIQNDFFLFSSLCPSCSQ